MNRDEKANRKALKGLQESQDILGEYGLLTGILKHANQPTKWEKQLPSAFQYSHNPALHEKHVFRKPLMLMGRLLLNYSIPVVLADEKTALTEYIASTSSPPSFPQLYAPKIIARPAKLSSGEYEMLTQILATVLGAVAPSSSEDLRGAWWDLMIAQKKLYNV